MYKVIFLSCILAGYLDFALAAYPDVILVHYSQARSWSDASDYCHDRRGQLAEIYDDHENSRVSDLCAKYDDDCWFGYAQDRWGSWGWDSESHQSYTNWDSREPNGDSSRTSCARFRDGHGDKWYDRDCSDWYPFICEYEHEEITLTCDLEPTKVSSASISGDIELSLDPPPAGSHRDGRITVEIDIEGHGIKEGDPHAIHIHEGNDLTDDGTGCGGHFNPTGQDHGCPSDTRRHVGDMGEITAWDGDRIRETIELDDIFEFVDDIIGRCIILHQKGDSCENPTGDAGDRYSQCLIEVKSRRKLLEVTDNTDSESNHSAKTNWYIAGSVGGSAFAIAGVLLVLKFRSSRKKYNAVRTVREMSVEM